MLRVLITILLNFLVFFTFDNKIFVAAVCNATSATIENRANVTSAQTQNDTDKINYRLPNIIKPLKYSLELVTYLDENFEKKFTFEGVVKILFFLKTNTKVITLHSEGLEIVEIRLANLTSEINQLNWKNESSKSFLHVGVCEENLMPTNYTLTIRYKGNLSDDRRGFYKISYDDENGKKRWLAATFLEPIAARRVLPCFDEPEYKAHFNLKINHHKNYSVVSNTKVKTQKLMDLEDRALTAFEETPRMSTYNLAFIISNFSTIINKESGHSIHARSSALRRANFSLQHEAEIFKKYEEILKIPFEINKMDLVAIPFFKTTGMENWGSIFFREKDFIYDPKLTPTLNKMTTLSTISHEYAHQWFGNLVTCKWWSDLWLQEGLATFLQNDILAEAYPKLTSSYKFFNALILSAAFSKDSYPSTHPVVREANSPEEIGAMLDTITYTKGSVVTRMMESFLTKKIFRNGLTLFLEKYKYSVADTDEFLKTIQIVIDNESYHMDHDLKTVMDTWMNRKGYPILNVTRDYQTKKVSIEQTNILNFFAKDEEKSLINYTWHIPINYATEKNHNFNETRPDLWLSNFSVDVQIPADPEDWILLNKQVTGYYRVNYDLRNWKMLCDYLKGPSRENIHAMNRVQLLTDAEFFYSNDFLDIRIVLDLIDGLKHETENFVFFFAFGIISRLNDKLTDTEYHSKYQNVVRGVVKQIIKLIESEESHDRDSVENVSEELEIEWICLLGTDNYSSKMYKKLESWLHDEKIEPDLYFPTIICGLKHAEWEMKKKLLDKVMKKKELCEQSIIWKALASTLDEKSLRYVINATLDDQLKYLEPVAIYQYIIELNPLGLDTFLDVLFERTFLIIITLGYEGINTIAELIAVKISTFEQLVKFEQALLSKFSTDVDTSLVIEKLAEKMVWLETNEKLLKTWFQENQS